MNVQSCVGFRVGFGPRGIVWRKSRDAEMVQDAGGVFNTGQKDNGGVGGKKGFIYSSSCDQIQTLRFVG